MLLSSWNATCCQGTIMSKKSRDLASAAMALLVERFPRCFDERNRRPLKIGINADVVVAMAGPMTARDVANALRFYTGSVLYQRALTAGSVGSTLTAIWLAG
jgi:sRNA-binding protein